VAAVVAVAKAGTVIITTVITDLGADLMVIQVTAAILVTATVATHMQLQLPLLLHQLPPKPQPNKIVNS
jgi:hypothetical protein